MLDAELTAAVDTTTAMVVSVRDAELGRSTPCAGRDVRGVLNHLMGVLTVAERAGRKAAELDAAQVWTDRVVGDWRAGFTELVQAARRAWADGEAWLGETVVLGDTVPAAEAGRRLIGELVVHGWDLARAVGRPYQPDAAAVRLVHEYLERTLAEHRSPGAWAPEVPVPASAPLLDRVLGLSGRDPRWA